MDRLDLRLPSPQHPAGSARASAPDPAAALWDQFAAADSVESFVRSWLDLQCVGIDGVWGGVVLLGPSDTGPFTPAAVWPDRRRSMTHVTATAEHALRERRGIVRRRGPDSGPQGAGRERHEIAYPIELDGKLHGVIALDVVPRPEPELQTVLRQLQWGSAWLEVLFRREQATRDAATKERLQMVLDLLASGLGHDRFRGAATAFVTAVATRLGCDRVSLGVLKRRRAHVVAFSHSAQFGQSSNLIRAVGAAMDEALDQQATVVLPPPPDRPALVTRAHAELARQHGSGAICTVPLTAGGHSAGTLTLERPATRPFDAPTVELCEALAELAGPVLDIHRREDRWLTVKAADAAGRQLQRLIGPRHVGRKLAAAGLTAAVLFFAVAEGDYRVAAKTVMEAGIRQATVAPFNGYVAEAPVRAGDLVRPGQLLCALDDREMRLERRKWSSQQEQLIRQHQQALAKRDSAQVKIVQAQIDQARAQIALLDDQISRMRVLAPFEGVVVAGDLSQSIGAPVERGQVLFEVAPLGAYRAVLQVDERDITGLAVAQRGQLLLAAAPDDPLPFVVEKITPVSTAKEGRNYFRVEARLERTPERLRPGMEGVAKVEVDRRLLVWIWTRQVIDWVRLQVWTWLP